MGYVPVHMNVCACEYVPVHVSVCVYVPVHVCALGYMCACGGYVPIHVNVCACVYVPVHVSVCACGGVGCDVGRGCECGPSFLRRAWELRQKWQATPLVLTRPSRYIADTHY